jgi:hypothetical protein
MAGRRVKIFFARKRTQNMKIAAAAAIVGSASAWSTLTMKANPRKCTRESFLVTALLFSISRVTNTCIVNLL